MRFQQRSGGGDLNRLVDPAHREFHVHIDDARHIHSHPCGFGFSESVLVRGYRVIANLEVGDGIHTVSARLQRLGEAGIHVLHSDTGLRHGSSRFVGNGPPDRAPILRERQGAHDDEKSQGLDTVQHRSTSRVEIILKSHGSTRVQPRHNSDLRSSFRGRAHARPKAA